MTCQKKAKKQHFLIKVFFIKRHTPATYQNDILKQFLNSCDIVKFAKYIPRIEEGKDSIQLARKLVEEAKVAVNETDSVSSK